MSLPEPQPDHTAGQIAQAARDAVDAAANSQQIATILAVLKAQQIVQNAQPHACQHRAPKLEFNAKKWIVIGGTTCVGALAFALASIAIAIGGVALTCCVLVLRSMWREYMSEKR